MNNKRLKTGKPKAENPLTVPQMRRERDTVTNYYDGQHS